MIYEVVVFPDVVATALDFLAEQYYLRGIHDVKVGARIPLRRVEKFVVARVVDAQIYDIAFQRSVVRVECWTDDQAVTSQEDAQAFAQLTRALLGAMRGTTQPRGTVYLVADEGGPQGLSDQPDSETGRDRYVFYVSISMRGVAS